MSYFRLTAFMPILVLFLLGNPITVSAAPMRCNLGPGEIGTTCGYSRNFALPSEGSTTFRGGYWNARGTALALAVAEHELLHATGFFVGYDFFVDHIDQPVSPGDRNFYSGTCSGNPRRCTGKVILALLPSADGTHVDTTVANQTLDLMGKALPDPPFPLGYPDTSLDAVALEAAFHWHALGGIDVKLVNQDPALFEPNDLEVLGRAEQFIEGLFNQGLTGAPKNSITWNVFLTPEPGMLTLLGISLAVLGFTRRMHR